ncbi:MAG: hypothetical protein KC620_00755 [Myxococcales bacterium]|nr:hypothetical protein [Myxococcales bacterium]
MKHPFLAAVLTAVFALARPALAPAQTCGPTQQTIGWSQPNKVPIQSENATRWPVDASVRIAYGGPWCPTEDQVSLIYLRRNADNTISEVPLAAQVRLKTPYKLVTNAPDPLTILEIDPDEPFEERADYRVVVRPPNPALAAFAEHTIEFRTRGAGAEPIPDFEGALSVELDGNRCQLDSGPFEAADNSNPACPTPNRLRLAVLFQPLDRPEIAYSIYRTSTTPMDEEGNLDPGAADETPIPVGFENGARDVLGTGIPMRRSQVRVPYYPIPRRDCFAVRALDEYGRERGDLEAETCIDLLPLQPCPEGCEPGTPMCFVFPEPNPFETVDPISGQLCSNIGINGGDPDRPIPPVGEDPEPEDDAGLSDGGMLDDLGPVDGDGGAGQGGGGGGGGCLRVAPGAHDTPWSVWLMLLAPALLALRRRRDSGAQVR